MLSLGGYVQSHLFGHIGKNNETSKSSKIRLTDLYVTEEKKPEKKLSLEDVRKMAADKARQGHTDEVRQLIQKFGADKLSGVDAAKYPALMEELEAMGHAD